MSSSSSSSPPNKRRKITACTFIGPPPKELSDVEALRFVFRNFKDLKQKNGEEVPSDTLMAHGHRWILCLYPQGSHEDSGGYVGCYLGCIDASERNQVEAKFQFHLPQLSNSTHLKHTFNTSTNMIPGCPNIVNHSDVVERLRELEESSFIVDVNIQVYMEKKPVWYPKRKDTDLNLSLTLRPLLESNIESDITFVVGDGQERIHAHRCVLAQRAPGLYEFIKDLQPREEFVLSDIDVASFRILLEYIYTGDLPEGLFKKDKDDEDRTTKVSSEDVDDFDLVKSLLFASNRYGIIYVKLYMESEILAKSLTIENAAEWLCIADAQVCPLLKEECMKLFVKDKPKFKSSGGWKNFKESPDLLEELLDYHTTDNGGSTNADTDYDKMPVRMLREQLESKDLDLDGTRTMLVQRLKEFHNRNQNPDAAGEAAAAAAAEIHL